MITAAAVHHPKVLHAANTAYQQMLHSRTYSVIYHGLIAGFWVVVALLAVLALKFMCTPSRSRG